MNRLIASIFLLSAINLSAIENDAPEIPIDRHMYIGRSPECNAFFQKLAAATQPNASEEEKEYLADAKKLVKLTIGGYSKINRISKKLALLQELAVLDISKCKLDKFPKVIGQLQNLEALYLQENNLTGLPEELGQLKKLKELNLSENPLKKFPGQILKLEQLRYLNLRETGIYEVPKEIGELTKLERLIVSKNSLKELPPQISKLQILRVLDLSDNKLQSSPPELGLIPTLKIIYLSGNQLQDFPAQSTIPDRLRWLDLSENKIFFTPHSHSALTNYENLDLSDNWIVEFPTKQMFLASKDIDLRRNKLMTLPEYAEESIKLDSVSRNPFVFLSPKLRKWLVQKHETPYGTRKIVNTSYLVPLLQNPPVPQPDADGELLLDHPVKAQWLLEAAVKNPELLATIQTIKLSKLCERTLAQHLRNKFLEKQGDEKVVFSTNSIWLIKKAGLLQKLISYPDPLNPDVMRETLKCNTRGEAEAFFLMLEIDNDYHNEIAEKLTHLDLSGLGLPEFPKTLFILKKLKVLNLMHNNLYEIPAAISVFLSNLEWLHLEHNNISEIPEQIWTFPELTFLGLGENRLQTLPPLLHPLPKLQSITLNDNPLNIDAFPALDMLRKTVESLEDLPEKLQLELINHTDDGIMPRTKILQLLGYPIIAHPDETEDEKNSCEENCPEDSCLGVLPHQETLALENCSVSDQLAIKPK